MYTMEFTTASLSDGGRLRARYATGMVSGARKLGRSRSTECDSSRATWISAWTVQSPNQFSTQRLNRAGLVAALDDSPSSGGFMVKTTCKFLTIWLVNHL